MDMRDQAFVTAATLLGLTAAIMIILSIVVTAIKERFFK